MTARFVRRAVGLAAVAVLVIVASSTRAWLPHVPWGHLLPFGSPTAVQGDWTCTMHPDVSEPGPGRCPICGMTLVLRSAHQSGAEPPESAGTGVAAPPTAHPAERWIPHPDEPRAGLSLDTRRQQLIGVRTVPVVNGLLASEIRAVGLVRADETRLTDVNVKTSGWVEELFVDYTGKLVTKGDPLFRLYSPELLTAQREYLLALEGRDRVASSQIPESAVYADRLIASSRERLRLWDLDSDQIASLEQGREPEPNLLFRAPASGYVLQKDVVQGMRVDAGQTLLRLADLSSVWVEADIYESEAALVRVGTQAVVTLDAYPGERFSGRAVYVYPFVEETTRTLKVRFEFPNRAGRLKPGMYATVAFTTDPVRGLLVPPDAIVDSGIRQVVFVAQGDGYFEPRQVTVGRRTAGAVQILTGLGEGERVAAAATFFIDSESQLRAALQGYAELGEPEAAEPEGPRLEIDLHTEPSPPRSGQTAFEVTVREANGAPVVDADVQIVLYMPPMPSMNMPAMRSEGRLAAAGEGLYRGPVEVMMPGRWDVTISVSRGGLRLGSAQTTVVAR